MNLRSIADLPQRLRCFFREQPWIAALVVVGALLRLAGIAWGLPIFGHRYNFHPDEWPYLLALYSFPHHLVFQKNLSYPMFVPYAVSLLSPFQLFFSTISNIVNLILTGKGGAVSFTWVSLKVLGRFVTVLLGTGSIVLTAMVARRLFGVAAAIVATAFMALVPFAVSNASFFTPAVPSSFFLILMILATIPMRERGDVRSYALVALTLGMLIATMYPAVVAAIIPLWIHAERAWKCEGWGSRLRVLLGGKLWFLMIVTMATFFALSPVNLIHFRDMIATIVEELWRANTAAPVDRSSGASWLQLGLKNIELMGPAFAILVGVSVISSVVWLNRRVLPLLLVPLICWIAFVGTMRPRHMVLLLPIYALLMGRCFGSMLSVRVRLVRITASLVLVIASGLTLVTDVQTLWARYHDVRPEVAAFIEERIPAGATVGIKCLEGGDKAYTHEHFNEFMWDFPLIDRKRYQLTDCLKNPEYLILSEYSDKYPETALRSGLLEGDVWPAEETGLWWREKIPAPELMRLYRELLTGTSACYELIRDYPSQNTERDFFQVHYDLQRFRRVDRELIERLYLDPLRFTSFEYPSPEVRIYQRTDTCLASEGR